MGVGVCSLYHKYDTFSFHLIINGLAFKNCNMSRNMIQISAFLGCRFYEVFVRFWGKILYHIGKKRVLN